VKFQNIKSPIADLKLKFQIAIFESGCAGGLRNAMGRVGERRNILFADAK